MSSSFIEYRGYGFWSHDSFTERLIAEVSTVASRVQERDWLKELSAHWALQSSGGFAGWIHLKLDEFVTDDLRSMELQQVITECVDHHSEKDPIHQTGLLLLSLLQGKVVWTATSPLDYMVGREGSQPD